MTAKESTTQTSVTGDDIRAADTSVFFAAQDYRFPDGDKNIGVVEGLVSFHNGNKVKQMSNKAQLFFVWEGKSVTFVMRDGAAVAH